LNTKFQNRAGAQATLKREHRCQPWKRPDCIPANQWASGPDCAGAHNLAQRYKHRVGKDSKDNLDSKIKFSIAHHPWSALLSHSRIRKWLLIREMSD